MNSPKPQKSSKKVKNIKAERKNAQKSFVDKIFTEPSLPRIKIDRQCPRMNRRCPSQPDGPGPVYSSVRRKISNEPIIELLPITMISPREYVYYYRLFIYSVYFYLFILECRWRGTFSETQMRLQLNQLNQSQTRVVIFLLQLSLSQK